MKQKIFSIIAVTAIIIMNSCKDNGTGPTQKPFKNPREMTWTADTLQVPEGAIQLLPRNLLVFSPNDAWLVCWSDVINGLMWHYDGEKWTHSSSLEQLGGFRVADIAGKSSNDLWTAGYSGENVFMAYYKGVKWERYYPNIKGDILDMSTDPKGNIWVCGRNGLVMKYENNKWIADTIKVGYLDVHTNSEYLLRSIVSYNNKAHLLGGIYDSNLGRYVNYHFQGDMNNWELLDSMIVESPASVIKWGDLGLFSNSKKLYSYGSLGIWEYLNNGWQKMYDFDGEIYDVYSVADDYLLAVSAYNTVLFFNGENWEAISDIFLTNDPTFVFNNVWTDGYETIIAGYGTISGKQETIIWHGK